MPVTVVENLVYLLTLIEVLESGRLRFHTLSTFYSYYDTQHVQSRYGREQARPKATDDNV